MRQMLRLSLSCLSARLHYPTIAPGSALLGLTERGGRGRMWHAASGAVFRFPRSVPMSSRPLRHRVVGALSAAYAALSVLFWAWLLTLGGRGLPAPDSGFALLGLVLFVAAPLLLGATGLLSFTARAAGPDARAVRVAAAAVLAAKAAVAGTWAAGLLAAGRSAGCSRRPASCRADCQRGTIPARPPESPPCGAYCRYSSC
jgi:hypothetical protein